MKKIRVILMSALLALVAIGAEAQNLMSIGVVAGTNRANYSIKGDSAAISNDLGYEAGVSVSFKFPFMSLTPELWYNYSKFTIDQSSAIFNNKRCEVKSQAIVMPILASYSLLLPLKLELGPTFTLYDSAKGKLSDGTSVDLGKLRSTVGLVAGLKLTVARKIILSARYNVQLGKRSFGANDQEKLKYSSYSFGIGYRL